MYIFNWTHVLCDETSLQPSNIIMQSQEAASIGIVQCVSFKESPVVVDARKLETHTAEVSLSIVKSTF